jgi:hypothetical protein
MNKIFLAVAFIGFLTLVGCKGETSHTNYIQNNSTKELQVVLTGDNIPSYRRTHAVPAGEKVAVYLKTEEGAKTATPKCLEGITTVAITYATDSSVVVISKDPNLEDNWSFEQNKKSQKVHNYCTFNVAEEDL